MEQFEQPPSSLEATGLSPAPPLNLLISINGEPPEAEIGHRVEDLWEVAEPQLSPSEKLNSCFEDIVVASFPCPLGSQDHCYNSYFSVRLF
uniref:Uncharacterized protein n=1 Tax=Oryza sativa subsp. japonica TaxID=39947 RepID=Q2QUG9_ORYSJ|nr:hypothetical protein LOC_Os12g16300 [Oryza sativa Japonica Group]